MNTLAAQIPEQEMVAQEPSIIAFCCHYCAFTAADLAGTMRQQYPPNVHIVRFPCTGRLEINIILQALLDGADGVLVAGCEPGGCHFIKGNLRAAKRVGYCREVLAEAGVNPERVEMRHIAASQGPLFAETARQFTAKIRALKTEAGCAAASATALSEDSA